MMIQQDVVTIDIITMAVTLMKTAVDIDIECIHGIIEKGGKGRCGGRCEE
jgi:hypothetical protein